MTGTSALFSKNINLTLNKGEILGIAGVSGNGQSHYWKCWLGLGSLIRDKFYSLEKI